MHSNIPQIQIHLLYNKLRSNYVYFNWIALNYFRPQQSFVVIQIKSSSKKYRVTASMCVCAYVAARQLETLSKQSKFC